MQTFTHGAYRAKLTPTRNVGEFAAKLAKCNGRRRDLPLRDTRTKSEFPRFRPGMSTADYVRAFESGHLVPWQWAQLNDAPCTLYSGEDTCETLPDGFDTWDAFDARDVAAAAPETPPVAPIECAAPVAPETGPGAPGAAVVSDDDANEARAIVEEFYDFHFRNAPGETVPVEKMEEHASAKRAPVYAPDAPMSDPSDIGAALRRGLDRIPYHHLPLFARVAIERLDADSSMRNSATLARMVEDYARTYGTAPDDSTRASAHYIAGRRFWDFSAAPDDAHGLAGCAKREGIEPAAPTDPAPAAAAPVAAAPVAPPAHAFPDPVATHSEPEKALPYAGFDPVRGAVYRAHIETAKHSRAIDPTFSGMLRRPKSPAFLEDFAAPAVRAHRLAIARSVRAERSRHAVAPAALEPAPRVSREAFDAATAAAADTLARLTVSFAPDRSRAASIDRGRVGAIGARGAIVAELTRLADAKHWHGWRDAGRALADLAAADAAPTPDPLPTHSQNSPSADPLATHSQSAPVADPLATHSAADNGFAHRVATAAAFISSGRNPTRAFDNCLEMYDGAAVAVALMRRAEKRPDSKMAANIWRYLCRSATESSAAEQPAGMSLPEWSRMLVRRAQGESDAMRTAPLPSESDNAAPIECEPVPDVAAEVAAPIAPMPAEPAPVPGKSAPETVMLSHVLAALQCIAPDSIPDSALLAREADRIEATAKRLRDAMPDYSATCATVARDLRAMADSAIDPLPGKSEPAADPFDAWQAAPNDPKPTFGAYSYAKRTGRTVIAYCGDGRIQSCAKAAGMRYVHRVQGFVGTPKQAEKMRAAWLAGAMHNAERAKASAATPGSLRAMLESLAVPTHTPLPGDTKPEALEDDETIPAPLDGLDVVELGDDGMAEFEQAAREQATAPAYRELTTAHYRPQGPCLRIPAFDARAMIPQRFAPVYLLRA